MYSKKDFVIVIMILNIFSDGGEAWMPVGLESKSIFIRETYV